MDLSVLIPARNEMFLRRTVEDVLANARAETEVIVVLDGAPAVEPLTQHDRLTVVILPDSIGQRAATNLAARLSDARYVMKLDAHCMVAEGFDVELIRAAGELGRNVTQIPQQYNLHAFDWVCGSCANRTYQGPTPVKCDKCGAPSPKREMVWKRREKRLTTAWRFDETLHFQYFPEWQKRPEGRGEIADTMSCLGACWFLERERYWQLDGMDEGHGSWGQMGTELGCKSWLSGGRMVTNKRTWFAHMFRTQGGDFGFPYELRGRDVDKARKHSQSLWFENKWRGQVRPLSWLVEHFWPVPGWSGAAFEKVRAKGAAFELLHKIKPNRDEINRITGKRIAPEPDPEPTAAPEGPVPSDEQALEARVVIPTEVAKVIPDLFIPKVVVPNPGMIVPNLGTSPTKGVIYYSDAHAPGEVLTACRDQLRRASGELPIVAVTLEPTAFFCDAARNMRNVVLPLERGYLTMAKQILVGLEASTAEVIYFCEHDVLYHPSHFDFTPPRTDEFGITTGYWYNENVWKVDAESGRALFYYVRQLSGLCARRNTLLTHFRKRVELIEKNGFNRKMGFEPGTHRRPERVDDLTSEAWMSAQPNIDIRHGDNLTPSRWSREQFRNQRFTRGWTEADCVPGWGLTKGRFPELLKGVLQAPAAVR
jgi:hypothetical protein